jgi:hypothetical protein
MSFILLTFLVDVVFLLRIIFGQSANALVNYFGAHTSTSWKARIGGRGDSAMIR